MSGLLVLALGAIPLRGVILSASAPDPVAVSVAAPAPDGWARFQAPDGAFDVTGPGEPVVASIATGLGAAHEARFTEGFRVIWSDASVSTAPDRRILADVWARSIQTLVGRVADEEADLTDAGHPGFGISLTADGQHLAMHVFVAGGRFLK